MSTSPKNVAGNSVQFTDFETEIDIITEKKNISNEEQGDELKDLERQIAEIHHQSNEEVQNVPTDTLREKDQVDNSDKNQSIDSEIPGIVSVVKVVPVEDGLEHEDLIAVLKGLDTSQSNTSKEKRTQSAASEPLENVTIEGEGQYQIMDVFDAEVADSEVDILGETPLMTTAEIRAVAMEQIKNLTRANKPPGARRRKQDIKPMPLETTDLITSLGEDWSDDDIPISVKSAPSNVVSKKLKSCLSSKGPSPKKSSESSNAVDIKAQSKADVGATNVASENICKPSQDKVPTIATQCTPPPTGFKRTRVIKRKIIWDPDETQFSYAQLLRNSNTRSPLLIAPSKEKKETQPIKKFRQSTTRPITPKNDKKSVSETIEKKVQNASLSSKSRSQTILNMATSQRRSETPSADGSSSVITKKRKYTEIDRLMGDEGAANMLNSLENELGKLVDSDEDDNKPHRPLMRSRASTISEKIIKRDLTPTPTSVRKSSPVPTKAKRVSKPKTQKASSSWDYVYQQQVTEDSMIIRRRSNSSYSSSTSVHRLSLDTPITPKSSNKAIASPIDANNTNQKISSKNSTKSGVNGSIRTEKSFEFAKPESKSNQKTVHSIKSNPLTSDMKKGSTSGKRSAETASDTAVQSEVLVKKFGKVSQIIFSTYNAKLEYTFTVQLMSKIINILEKLTQDSECYAVVITTNAPHFCQGIDFSDICDGPTEKRNNASLQMANTTKKYLKTLASFPKPLIAGVNGSNINLGVTQLALFDIVIASEKSTFETQYVKYGQLPEGYCIWANTSKIRSNFKIKMFWLGEKLNSNESVLNGFVYKLTSASRVNDDALIIAKRIANMSSETYRAMKKANVTNQLNNLENTINEEFEIILSQWNSTECTEKINKYLQSRSF